VQFAEIPKDQFQVIGTERPFGMPRNHHGLPGSQVGVESAEGGPKPSPLLTDLAGQIPARVFLLPLQPLNILLDSQKRLLKVQKAV